MNLEMYSDNASGAFLIDRFEVYPRRQARGFDENIDIVSLASEQVTGSFRIIQYWAFGTIDWFFPELADYVLACQGNAVFPSTSHSDEKRNIGF